MIGLKAWIIYGGYNKIVLMPAAHTNNTNKNRDRLIIGVDGMAFRLILLKPSIYW